MQRKRISAAANSARALVSTKKKLEAKARAKANLRRGHFAGVFLGGGKSDKTCLAFLEYYSDKNKLFLTHLSDKIKGDGDVSGDLVLFEELSGFQKPEFVGINAPLSLPKCIRCKLKCPGFEICEEKEIQWMWDIYRNSKSKRKSRRLFTPYTERCADLYLNSVFEEPFHVDGALGSNRAPLFARAHFLKRRLKLDMIEVSPKMSLWRIGRSLNIQKSYLRFHKHAADGDKFRAAILKELVSRDIAFLYEQDVRLMVENPNAFDAFICALTAVLKSKGQCEGQPKAFPKGEAWIEIPSQDIIW
jgi:hypothetical protein